MAFSAYRMVYASVWDFRFNHVPVTRNVGFGYGLAQQGYSGFKEAVATRKAGWGVHEGHVFGGAPFDAVLPPPGSIGVPPPQAMASGTGGARGGADAGDGAPAASGSRIGMKRFRNTESVVDDRPAAGAEKIPRKPAGGGMFKRGDENV